MVAVDVQVAEGVDELARFEPADVREHVRQERVGADVEGDAEEGVGRTLVELAVERAAALDLELEERVARRQINLVRDARVPARDDEAARVRVTPNLIHEPRDLIHAVALRVMTAERAPEVAVDGAEVSFGAAKAARVSEVGPLLPDVHARRAQGRLVGVAGEEPEKLLGYPAEGDALRGDDGEALAQVVARLVAEVRDGADPRPVFVLDAARENGLEQVLILSHSAKRKLKDSS